MPDSLMITYREISRQYSKLHQRNVDVKSPGEALFIRTVEERMQTPAEWFGTPLDVVYWEYEPEKWFIVPAFEFDGIKYGGSHYVPDFKLSLADGTTAWVEIKGFNLFRQRNEDLVEKLFVHDRVMATPGDRYVKLAHTRQGLVRNDRDKSDRREMNTNKARRVTDAFKELEAAAGGKGAFATDLERLRLDTARYRKNPSVVAKRSFILENERDIKAMQGGDAEAQERLREGI